jgi:ACT domain-containing protein
MVLTGLFSYLTKKTICQYRENGYLTFWITHPEKNMNKTIITVVGKDAVGIIAKVCTYLSNNQINVEDISQTIVQGYFNMMMIVDTGKSTLEFGDMARELERLGVETGVHIRCQREEIFEKMHRI